MPRKNLTVAEIVAQRKARTYTHRLYLDPDRAILYEDLAETVPSLVEALREARFNFRFDDTLGEEVAAAEKALADRRAELEALKAELEDTVTELKFTKIPRVEFERIMEACPPSEDQKKRFGDKAGGFDPDQLGPTLMAACASSPTMTIEEATLLWTEQLSSTEAVIMIGALSDLNSRQIDSLGKG